MERLHTLYESYFGCPAENVLPVGASASNRRYFRMVSDKGGCIGAIGTDSLENKAFAAVSGHLCAKGINVPKVFAVSEDGMAYIQQDLGNVVLFDRLTLARKTGERMEKVEEILCRTMSMLPVIQFEGADGFDFSVCYPQASFDRRMVMFDLNYFKYCFLKPSGLEFNEMLLQEDFERLADRLLTHDTDTFMYRDFNARNVMIHDGAPYFIDFQGGRRGPIYYDVASFVWHARASYPETLKERMLEAYLEGLKPYMQIPRVEFDERMKLFRLFRLLQVLGAYGFRGWTEHKADFVTAIPSAIKALGDLLDDSFDDLPYLMETLGRLATMERFLPQSQDGKLEVTIYSFSFKKGIPSDPSGNGGGYVFDCRSIHNPGRYEPYRKLTGRDEPVIEFLENDGEIIGFLDHVYGVVCPHVETFRGRGFTNLMVSFGCTGGQHRSVYCAEHLAHHLAEKYPDIHIRLIHREQNIDCRIS